MDRQRLDPYRRRTPAGLGRYLSLGIAMTALCWTAPSASAQGEQYQECGDVFLELWVDPVFGADPTSCDFDPCSGDIGVQQCAPSPCRAAALARAGDPSQPYRTLNAAIFGAWLGLCPPSSPAFDEALIHADPGLYSPGVNGENLPVIMRTGVHVQ